MDALPRFNDSRNPGLDLLRALAILLVFCWHYRSVGGMPHWALFSRYGWAGVDLFFVLSGYLIASQFLRPFASEKRPSLRLFWLKRALRILPSYLVVVTLYFIVPQWNEGNGLPSVWRFLTFTRNFGLDRSQAGGFSHSWSLCVEEHFYLFLPLASLLIFHLRKRIKPVFATTAMLALTLIGGMALRAWLWIDQFAAATAAPHPGSAADLYDRIIYYPTYSRLDGLCVGVTLALAMLFRPASRRLTARFPNLILGAGLCLLSLAAWITSDRLSFASAVFGFPVVSLGFGALIWGSLSEGSWLCQLRIPGAALLATLAYSFYLTHKEIIHLVRPVLVGRGLGATGFWMFITVFGCCWIAALIQYLLVERPFLRLRDRVVAGGHPLQEGMKPGCLRRHRQFVSARSTP